MINSYLEIDKNSMNGFIDGIFKVRYIGNGNYRCFGIEFKVPFGECPEVYFFNLTNK